MPWSGLSLLQWMGLVSGWAAAAVLIWAIIVCGSFDRHIKNAILDASKEKNRERAAEEAEYLASNMRSIHGSIVLAVALFTVLFAVFVMEISTR